MAIILPIVFTILSVASIICNGLAKYIILTTKNAFSDPITIMVMTMAVSNGLYSFVDILSLLANGFDTGDTSHFVWPDAFCPVLNFARNATYCIPAWIFVFIAIERFLEIISPRFHHFFFNTRAVTCYMLFICGAGLIWSSPFAIFYRVKTVQPSNLRQCGITNFKSSFWRHYNTIHLVITYGIPLLICGIFYAISSCILCLLNRLSRDTAASTSSPSITSGIRVMIGLRKRTIKIMIYSIGLFLLGYTLAAIDVILTLRGSEIPAWLNDAGAILLAVSVSLGPLLFANYSYHFQQRVRELKKATRERIALLIGRAQQWALNQPAAPVPEPVTEIALQPLKSPIVHRTVTVQAHSSDQADNEINVPSCSTIPAVTHIMTRETLSTEHHK